ncbi:hypothetical protein [Aminobacter sp. BE322]|uniref:hypothetical protein n=1 Tax=unclassified Aminobacter TaxID=2644704 RepID=UPI003D2406EC
MTLDAKALEAAQRAADDAYMASDENAVNDAVTAGIVAYLAALPHAGRVSEEMVEAAKAVLFSRKLVDVFSVRAALEAALSSQAEVVPVGVACIACEGSPKAPNDPCGLCGTASGHAEAVPVALTYEVDPDCIEAADAIDAKDKRIEALEAALTRLRDLTPGAANAATARDLHLTIAAIADVALSSRIDKEDRNG